MEHNLLLHILTLFRRLFGNTRKIFSVKLGRDIFYILNDPRHVSTFYRETESLPFDHFLEKTIKGFGISSDGARKIFDKPVVGNRKSIVWRAHDMQAEQTRGRNLVQLANHMAEFLDRTLTFQENSVHYPSQAWNQTNCCWSLKKWTTEIIIHTIQDGYFGERLAEIDPELPHTLVEFDDLSYQAWYRYPKIFTPTRNRLQARIEASLTQFFAIPKPERKSQAWFTQALEGECREAGFAESDLVSLMLFMYWG
jgi:hypothetical protein